MDIKITKLAKLTMPFIAAVAMMGCGSSDESSGSGNSGVIDGLYSAAENEVVIYYKRDDAQAKVNESAYAGWGLHLWNGEGCTSTDLEAMGVAEAGTDWSSPYLATGISETYGAYYVLKVDPDANDPYQCMNFILHNGDDKAFGSANSKVELTKLGESQGLFGFHGSSEIFYAPIAERPVAIDGAKAHWVDAKTIAWESVGSASSLELRYDLENKIAMDPETKEVSGGTAVTLSEGTLSDAVKKRFPHLASLAAASIDVDDATLKTILKSQIVVVAKNAEGKATAATQVQKAGVIDAVFVQGDKGALSEELGAIVSDDGVTFKVWAPTAQNLKLYLYDDQLKAFGQPVVMTQAANGVWSAQQSDVVGKYYRYEVTVYHPTTSNIETRMVTDPYSLSLSANSAYSQVVDLESKDLKPTGWDSDEVPKLAKDIDHVLYESHLRDFSASDSLGTKAYNGKYLALTEAERDSVVHLKELQQAGLTTLHIMPAFDIATVDEDPDKVVNITDTVAKLCDLKPSAQVCETADKGKVIEDLLDSYDPTTGDAQALMGDLRALDSFNWGYDPYHYTVPEGSYATDAEGTTRIKEFREMVKATHDMGLQVVMDVVYNHTNASGVEDKSVLDKIVPGYYHRRNPNTGDVETSTCCDNTATENLMMGKLMTDSLVTWAKEYKIDGFRFDLMGHQPKDLMVDSLAAVRKVDDDTYFYGEGWDFGEVSNNARFEQSTQWNMAGTGIGTFSDRLRDAVRGGSPFDSGDGIRKTQGFGNADTLNDLNSDADSFRADALHNQDLIRLGMAGNLQKFVLLDAEGNTKRGEDVDYNGAKAGYTLSPSENISYVSKHDNQTLWDNNAYKATTGTSPADRARMQTVSLSTVMLGQGIPFIHMGSELLRSKSMQRDSYDSGDWFNRVDFSGQSNNWNVGLPRADKDEANWDLIKKIIADQTTQVKPADIALTKEQFLELLKIRSGSELFRLKDADAVKARVDFRNVGKEQVQGLIVMSIDDGTSAGSDLDANNDAIVVVLNATDEEQSFEIAGASGFELHPVQKNSADDVVQGASFANASFTVPARTTAVFVQPQDGAQGAGLPVNTSNKDLTTIPPFNQTVYVKGSMNDWADNDDYAMTFKGDGIYELTVSLNANDGYEFKFADSSWSSPNIGCDWATQAETSISLGDAENCKLPVSEDGLYKFTLDAKYVQTDSEDDKAIVSVTKSEQSLTPTYSSDIFLRGTITTWDTPAEDSSAKFAYTATNTYRLTLDLTVGDYEMKIADAAWTAAVNFGADTSVALDSPVTLDGGSASANMKFSVTEAGSYTFTLNTANADAPVLTVSQ
ncbi:pullulanase-type alpha-1,6-glucosidase [Agarivorans sp. QJM3NY_25]|uniref:pullulanase-type alpha-1,6-glucosidase n=1 Tax=Agarivorans sp. QJM3NY_25 TaxID=3421430 RepID=UPI003D7E1371